MSVCQCQRLVPPLYGLALIVAMTSGMARAQAPARSSTEQQPQLAVWGGYGDSDNIGRTSLPEPGTYSSLGLFLGLERQTSRLEAAINSDVEYRSYSDETFENDAVGTLDARALVGLVQDRFSWEFEGNLDQGQSDPFAARGPNNRETIKYLSTGPQLDIPFGRTSLMMSANRSARRYERSAQVDNDSNDFQIALARQTRPATSFALVAASSETEYVDGLAPTYQIDRLFVRIEKTSSNGTLSADLGTNEISSDAQKRRDPLLNLTWDWSVGARSTLGITAAQGFTNSGDVGTGGSTLVTTDPAEQKTLGVNYSLGGERTTFRAGIGAGEEDYAGSTAIDNDYQSAVLTIDYRVTMRLSIGARYDRYDREYTGTVPTSQEETTAGIWLNRTLGRRFSIALDVSRYESTGIDRVEETRSEFRFAYSPTGDTSRALTSIGR